MFVRIAARFQLPSCLLITGTVLAAPIMSAAQDVESPLASMGVVEASASDNINWPALFGRLQQRKAGV